MFPNYSQNRQITDIFGICLMILAIYLKNGPEDFLLIAIYMILKFN